MSSHEASKSRQDALWGLFFILPFLVVAGVFLIYPLGYALFLSFRETHLYSSWANQFMDMKWLGFGNYTRLLGDPVFWYSVLATGIYAAIVIPLNIAAGLALALALSPKLPGAKAMRSMFFLPHVFDTFVVGVIWLLIFNPKNGPLAAFFNGLGISYFTEKGFVDNPITVLPSIAVAMVLKGMGFTAILFLTALNNISASVFEAADIDGCTPWQKLRHVILPLLRPMLLFMCVTGLVGSLNAFTEFFALTNKTGGPAFSFFGETVQAGRVSGLHLYRMFDDAFYGRAAAMSFLLLILALIITAVQFRVLREK